MTPVTHARDTLPQACDTDDESYVLDFEVYDAIMTAKGIHGPSARAREIGVSRATHHRVSRQGRPTSLRVAMRFAKAAGVSVNKLFPQAQP
jgi:hypothetical protein